LEEVQEDRHGRRHGREEEERVERAHHPRRSRLRR
jgi:hypothetical protein